MRVTIEIPDGASGPSVRPPEAVEPGTREEAPLDAGAAPTTLTNDQERAGGGTNAPPPGLPGEPTAMDAGPPAADLVASLEGEPRARAPEPGGTGAPATRTNGEARTRQPPGFPVGLVEQPGDSVRLEVYRGPGGQVNVRSLPG